MAGITGITVTAYKQNGIEWEQVGSATTNDVGEYDIGGLISGSYRIEFTDGDGRFLGEFYNNADTLEGAQTISVTSGQTVANINASLATAGHIIGKVTEV